MWECAYYVFIYFLDETTENINQNISAGENKTTTVDSEGLPCAPDTRFVF